MTLRQWLPLLTLVLLIAVAYAFGLQKHLTVDALRDNRALLIDYVGRHWVVAALAFVAVYVGVVTLSLPAASLMTLSGGLLFGVPVGVMLSVLGATLGSAIFFVIARTAFGDALRKNAGPLLARMSEGFAANSFSYLLFLRLVPAFPFFAVNLAAALLGMSLRSFIVGTMIGILPGVAVSTAFGAGLGEVFDHGGAVTLKSVFSPTLLAALMGLAVLSLLPVAAKVWRARTE